MKMNKALFQPNTHSNKSVSTTLADKILKNEVQNISRLVDDIVDIDRQNIHLIMEGIMSTNLIVTEQLLFGGSRDVVYKRFNVSKSLEELEWSTRLHEFLNTRNVSVPKPLRFSESCPFTVFDGKNYWQRSLHISGNHYDGNKSELESAARQVSRLHQALKEYPETNKCSANQFGTLDWSEWISCIEKVKGSQSGDLVLENMKKLEEIVREINFSLGELKSSFLSQEQLIHADIHPGNLISDGNSITAILDFGEMSLGRLGVDIANACHRLVRQHIVAMNKGIMDDKREEFLKQGLSRFLSVYAETSMIDKNELKHLPVFMREILVRKIFHDMFLLAAGQKSDAVAFKEISKFLRLLEEVDEIEKVL